MSELEKALERWDESEIAQYVEGTLPTIVDAARCLLNLTSPETIEKMVIAHEAAYDETSPDRYTPEFIEAWKDHGDWEDSVRAMTAALEAVLRSVEVCPKCGGSGELHSSRCDLVYDLHCEHDPCPSCVSGVVTKKEPDDRSR